MLPYVLSMIAFAVAFVIMEVAGTNRTFADLNAGTVGFGLIAVGIICSVVMLFTFPYRSAKTGDWLAFGGHFVLLCAALVMAAIWLGAHIA
ncbi:MAG TPA: hypothetical protein DCL54_06785 [Alphaproteobacteria bacterium]|nr:hypothetical protein [Alphaproteobacteria bacterium]HAJ46268.1 hypothetical protein [Alphaproteobacteria bacterium]